MTVEELAGTIAEQVNGMTKAQYLLLALSLDAIGGRLVFTLDDFKSAAGSPLPPLDISMAEDMVILDLKTERPQPQQSDAAPPVD
jgi:hypothetical protein